MIEPSSAAGEEQATAAPSRLCWICGANKADLGEHKTKRSDLLAVLGNPTQEKPHYYHDVSNPNHPVGSLNAKMLKSPIRICSHCNTTRTQPHDRAWERMSEVLRGRRPPQVDHYVRCNRIFPHHTRRQMIKVHLYFLKLFGCMLVEAGDKTPIDIAPFSDAIMNDTPHREVYLQLGRCDGQIGRSNLHCIRTEHGHVMAFWLYQLDKIAVSVMFAQSGGGWGNLADVWHPHSQGLSKRFLVADFRYARRAAADGGAIGIFQA